VINPSEAFGTLLKDFARQRLYTAIPAVVEAVNDFGKDQTVDVRPVITRVYDDGVIQQPGIVAGVPVVYPSGGGGMLSFPIERGDTVLVVYSMRSIDDWLESSGGAITQIPTTNRHHNPTDAIAIPGLYTKKSNLSPNTKDVELKFNNLSFRLEKSSGDMVLENPSHSLKLKADGSVLHSSGAQITAEGDFITATGVSLNLHVHAQANDSDNNVQVPTFPPTVI